MVIQFRLQSSNGFTLALDWELVVGPVESNLQIEGPHENRPRASFNNYYVECGRGGNGDSPSYGPVVLDVRQTRQVSSPNSETFAA